MSALNIGVDAMKERNDVIEALRPGRRVVETPTAIFKTQSYGLYGKKKISFRDRPWEEPCYSEDIRYLQLWYDDKFPGVACNEFENDQLMVEMSDVQLFMDRITVDPVKGIMKQSKFDRLGLVLRTMIPSDRLPSQSESLLGAIKRNLNAPELVNKMLSPRRLVEIMVKSIPMTFSSSAGSISVVSGKPFARSFRITVLYGLPHRPHSTASTRSDHARSSAIMQQTP